MTAPAEKTMGAESVRLLRSTSRSSASGGASWSNRSASSFSSESSGAAALQACLMKPAAASRFPAKNQLPKNPPESPQIIIIVFPRAVCAAASDGCGFGRAVASCCPRWSQWQPVRVRLFSPPDRHRVFWSFSISLTLPFSRRGEPAKEEGPGRDDAG